MASGSSVPAWPTRRWPKIRRHRATTSWEVQPASLSTTTSPVTGSGPAGLTGRAGPVGPGTLRVAGSGAVADPAQDLLDPAPGDHGRVGGELEQGGALHPGLPAHGPLQLGPAVGQGLGGVVGERAQVDGGMAQIRGGVHRGDRDQAQPLVGIGQPLELLGQHLAEDLVDPQRPRVGGGAPIVMPTT